MFTNSEPPKLIKLKEKEKGVIQNHNDLYNSYKLVKGNIDDYIVEIKIGRGRFSEVYQGLNIKTNTPVIIKILKPIPKIKIKREVMLLSSLKKGPNIIQIIDVLKDKGTHIYCLVYPSINTVDLKKLIIGISYEDIQIYMYQILKGLEYSHSEGIIHRDIKPGNIVVDLNTKELRIIDWGLAEVYIKDEEYNVRVATKYYKAPELLFHYKKYDYAVDMWSLGCLFAEMLFQKDYFFKGIDLHDQVKKIAAVVGKDEINNYIAKYPETTIRQSVSNAIQKYSKADLNLFKNNGNYHLITFDALDLLKQFLIVDHKERITASQALLHPFFAKIKDKYVLK